jgi:hypothetical protein
MRRNAVIVTLAILAILCSTATLTQAQVLKEKEAAAIKQRAPDVFQTVTVLKPSASLIGVLQVAESCGGSGAADVLGPMGLFYIKGISVVVYNRGNAASNPATGKVEFYDVATGRNKVFNFSVAAISPKEWGAVTPATLSTGAFLVRSAQGIKVSVTYTGGAVTTPKTTVHIEKICPTLY